MAWRAGLAAAAAWYLADLLPGVAGDYPYYAPLGALLVCYPTVLDSLRQSVRAVLATAVGVALGAVTLGVAGATWWSVAAAVVAVAVAVGIVVHLVLPPPPQNNRATRVVRHLRDGIADHLHDMSGVLAEQWPPEREEWTRRRHDFEPMIDATREAVVAADAGRRANLRARAYRLRGQQLFEAAQTLEQLAVLVRDISTVLAQTAWAERTVLVLDPQLRGPIAEAMADLARAIGSAELVDLTRTRFASQADDPLRDSASDEPHRENLIAAREALRRVTDRLDDQPDAGWEDGLAASGIVLHLRRCLDHLQAGPADRAPELHPTHV